MVVQSKSKPAGVIALVVGSGNVQRYFPPDTLTVELELDHLRIVCTLDASFWQDRPEIHDLRLSSWLEAKRTSGKIAPHTAPIAMIPCGERSFRLTPMAADERVDSLHPVGFSA